MDTDDLRDDTTGKLKVSRLQWTWGSLAAASRPPAWLHPYGPRVGQLPRLEIDAYDTN